MKRAIFAIAVAVAGIAAYVLWGHDEPPAEQGAQDAVRESATRSPQRAFDPAPNRVHPRAASERWVQGRETTYRIEADHLLAIEQPDGSIREVRTRVDADWQMTVLDVATDHVVVGHQLTFASFDSGALDARAAMRRNDALARGAMTSRHHLDGALTSVAAPESLDSELARLLRSHLADAQFVRPRPAGGQDTWSTREWAPSGSYAANYTNENGEVTRRKTDVDGTHETRFAVGKDGWPMQVYVDHQSTTRHAVGLVIDSDLTTQWSLSDAEFPPGRFDGFTDVHDRLDRASTNRLERFRSDWDAERASKTSLDELLDSEALHAMPESERARALMKLSSLLRHRPKLVDELTPERVAEMDTPTAVFTVSGLTGVQSEAAMDQVGEILGSLPPDEVKRRRGMAVAAALGRPATAGSIDGLEAFIDSDNGQTRSYGQLALGAQARDIEQRNPERSGSVRDQLYNEAVTADGVAELSTLIRALGNAADPRVLQLASQHSRHPNPIIRGALAYAMRFIDAVEAEQFIRARMLEDADRGVRQRALMAVAFRAHAPFADALRTVILEDTAEEIRLLAVTRLGQVDLTDADRLALQKAAADDPSMRVREKAAAVLEPPS